MWTVELWHDTTMWNEGFEYARDPIATVVVATEAEATALAAWVDQEHGLSKREQYIGFETRIIGPAKSVSTLAQAQQRFDRAALNADHP